MGEKTQELVPAKLVVATKYVLSMGEGGKYIKKNKKQLHPPVLVPLKQVEKTNKIYETGGNWYEVDETETKKRFESKKKKSK
jgi:hypothetical protein